MKTLNKQLWYKALDQAVPETYTTLSSEQLGKALDVYAELIVGECLAFCKQIADDASSQKRSEFLTQDGKMLYEGVFGGANNCGFAIQERFGVKI